MKLEGALAVTRFGLGALPDEIDIASRSPKAWLLDQLKTKNAQFPADKLVPSSEMYKRSAEYRRDSKNMAGDDKAMMSKTYGKVIRENFQSEIIARESYAAKTNAPFHERLTRFWSNHFSVSARNRSTRLFAGAYEREAIRPFITGSFYDLASNAIFHPGMLVFLDNINSIGPNSRAGKRRNRGLNENLAREVLELHTVTPAAAYSQNDVTEFAKALTGWTVGRGKRAGKNTGKSTFEPRAHEPGTRTVLGQKYSEKGQDQARAILKDICKRPETAENIARKLARHFVSDEPPAELVKELQKRFIETNGDLKAVYQTLIESEHAWSPEPQKVKTPEELLISTARMIGIENVFPKRVRDSYDSLAQPPFEAPTPEGWPDRAEAWIGPGPVMKRIEWANELASRMPNIDARQFLKSALGARVSIDTLQAVSRAESGQQALVMALMSPEFQRR